MSNPVRTVLIVDDNAEMRDYFADVASGIGLEPTAAESSDRFLQVLQNGEPTVLTLDLAMPGVDGVQLLRTLSDRRCRSQIVIVSGRDTRMLEMAYRIGTDLGLNMMSPLQKPVSVPALESALLLAVAQADDTITQASVLDALSRDEFIPFYQPKIKLSTGGAVVVAGAEALARWRHPTMGFVPPSKFLGIIEQVGAMSRLTDSLMSQIVADQVEWRGSGIDLPVAINISRGELTDVTLPDRLFQSIKSAALDPENLIVEVTEEAVMAHPNEVRENLMRLRLDGVKISLDDFGSGYSSLCEIYRLPIAEIKLDRSVVADLHTSTTAKTVVKAFLALARELDIPVCAEGIEVGEAARFLAESGCEMGQGYLFCRPVEMSDFRDLVHGSRSRAPLHMVAAE